MQSTVSNEPVSTVRQVRPPSVVRSVPVGPTARAADLLCGSQATPERYAGGGVCACRQLRPPSPVTAAARGEAWSAR
ncbi:hypothetical protein RKD22_006699 [Streptomyces pristinaespiralis]